MKARSLLLLAALAPACTGGDYDELGITCEGKCDGLSSIRALVSDWKKLDVQDLINIGASYATKELNDKLKLGSYGSLQLQPTVLYSTPAVAANDLTIENLDRLVSGLASRYGETSLTTEVNKLRSEYLTSSGKRAYAESAFRISGNFGHGWSLPTRGFGREANGSVSLGFDTGADLEARTISVHARESNALLASPLASISEARGFVLPQSIDHVRAMEPGESFALSGRGRLGLNLGAGVPVLVANPTSWLTYSLVVTAGLRSVFEGEVDVQLVRMRGDEVVIDVGVRSSTLGSASIALTDGWGIHGLVSSKVDVGGITVDLGKLLDTALQQRVASKLSLIRAAAERTQTSLRMSVARLRFHLDAAQPVGGREQALAQALRGDLRLAQALAARGDSGVVAEFDVLRSGAAAISFAGIDVLGMRFYTRQASSEGDAVIQTPGGALALMWESLHREGGWFFTSHGFTRIGVAGLRFDATKPGIAKSETNLFIQTEEGDKFMERDKVIDQLDSVLVSVGGKQALSAVEAKGNEIERLILARCPLPPSGEWFDEGCNIDLVKYDPTVASLRAQALAQLDSAIASLPAESRELLHSVAELRLAASSIEDPQVALVGPTASIVVDYRLDDAALRTVMSKDKAAFKSSVIALMEATQLDRLSTDPAGERTRIRSRSDKTAAALGDVFDKYTSQYQRLISIDGASIETLGPIGGNAIEVRFAVDANRRPDYESAISQSVAQARSQLVGSMFDALRDKAADMPSSGGSRAAHPEQIASFALLSLASPGHTELRVNFKTDNSWCAACGSRERYNAAGFASLDRYAHGADATPIGAGLFDIDALIQAPK